MKRIAVIDIVGLSSSVIGEHTPFIEKFIKQNKLRKIKPVLPALTTSAQTTYLTGVAPSEHGIVGNGWYDHRSEERRVGKECRCRWWTCLAQANSRAKRREGESAH